MLEGKALELFNEWMKPNPLEHGRFGQLVTNTFDSMPLSMQWGAIQDFADSLGYEIIVETGLDLVTEESDGFDYCINIFIEKICSGGFSGFKETRQEARAAAIKKLNELLNK